jgi:hypothetical protein
VAAEQLVARAEETPATHLGAKSVGKASVSFGDPNFNV